MDTKPGLKLAIEVIDSRYTYLTRLAQEAKARSDTPAYDRATAASVVLMQVRERLYRSLGQEEF